MAKRICTISSRMSRKPRKTSVAEEPGQKTQSRRKILFQALDTLLFFFFCRLIHPLPGQQSDTSAWYFLTSLAVAAADASQIGPARDEYRDNDEVQRSRFTSCYLGLPPCHLLASTVWCHCGRRCYHCHHCHLRRSPVSASLPELLFCSEESERGRIIKV